MSQQHLKLAYIRLAIRKLEQDKLQDAKVCVQQALRLHRKETEMIIF